MKVKHNKTLLILGLLAVVSLIGFALFFALTVTMKGGNFADVFSAIGDAFTGVGFKRIFIPSGGTGLDVAYCIFDYVLILFIFIGIIYSLYLFAQTKRIVLFNGILLALLAIIPVWAFMLGAAPEETNNAYRTFLFDTLFKGKFKDNSSNGAIVAVTWVYLILLVLSISISISFFVLAMIRSKRERFIYSADTSEEASEENDEASILAEMQEEPFPEEPVQNPEPAPVQPSPIADSDEEEYVEEPDIELEEEEEPEEEEEEIVCSESDLRAILQDIIKDAVRAELDKRDAERGGPNHMPPQPPFPQQPGINNGGPIIVQYINSNTQGNDKFYQPTNQGYPFPPYPYPYPPYPQQPMPQQKPTETQQPAGPENNKEQVKREEKVESKIEEKQEEVLPLKEEKVEQENVAAEPENEPEPEPVSKEEKVEENEPQEIAESVEGSEPVEEAQEPAQEEASEPAEEPSKANEELVSNSGEDDEGSSKIVRIPFYERILTVDKELQDLYSELKNELLSYGLKSRVAANGDTFRLHRKTYCRITVAGKSLKLYLALNPDDYKDSKMPYANAGNKATYAEIPFVFKVKSGLSLRRAKGLIADACGKDNLIQEDLMTTDWVKEIKAD